MNMWHVVFWPVMGASFAVGLLAGFELHHMIRIWRRRAINAVIRKFH